VKIFENLSFTSSYNLFADSLNWRPMVIIARTNLFKVITLNASATVDPYALDTLGRKINTAEWDQSGAWGRLTAMRVAVGFDFTSKRDGNAKTSSSLGTDEENHMIRDNPQQYVDFNVPWTLRLNYSFVYSKPAFVETITNTINLTGDLRITKNWKVGFRADYDLKEKDFSYSSIDVYRDLHCWELKFNVIPFGQRKSYRIDINVKAPILQDLKLSRKRSWYDL